MAAMDRLDGKVALITGASRLIGIGAAVARELADAGADIFLTYYQPYDAAQEWGSRPEEAAILLQELRASGCRADALALDLTEGDAAPRLFDAAEAALGSVTILVNNAAHSETGDIWSLDGPMLDRHYAVNVRATALLCREFVTRFPAGAEGRIINLTSGQGVGPMPDELAYAASKGAVEALTLSLSAAVAQMGITVNAVDPGATDTGWMSPELKAALAQRIPLGRVAQPADAARLIRFLASPAAAYITGQIIHSRGGL